MSVAFNPFTGSFTLIPPTGAPTGGDTIIDGNLTVYGNVSAQGTTTFANTIFTTTSALCSIANSTGPALYISQTGTGDLASFYDFTPITGDSVEVLHVGATIGNPYVGIYTSYPNKELTVVGDVSATNYFYDSVGNSNQWNSAYNTVNNSSANWDSAYNTVNNSSANWDNVYTNVTKNSSAYLSAVNLTLVQNASGNWDSAYNTVNNSSANWDSAYNTVNNSSANWDSAYNTVNNSSANWDNVYTNVTKNSSAYLSAVNLTLVQNASGNWNSVYSLVNTTTSTTFSANNISVQNQVQFMSGGAIKVYQYYNTITGTLDTIFN